MVTTKNTHHQQRHDGDVESPDLPTQPHLVQLPLNQTQPLPTEDQHSAGDDVVAVSELEPSFKIEGKARSGEVGSATIDQAFLDRQQIDGVPSIHYEVIKIEGAVGRSEPNPLITIDGNFGEDEEETQQQQQQEKLQANPHQTPTPYPLIHSSDDEDELEDDVDAVGRSEFIRSMRLEEGKEGADDPFTEKERLILDRGVRQIKAALADKTKTKVRTTLQKSTSRP